MPDGQPIDPHNPVARSTDPTSSHEAAAEITASGLRASQCEQVYEAVRTWPGKTALELAKLSGIDRYVVSRRLSEVEKLGFLARGPSRICTEGKRTALTWNVT